MVRNLGNFRNAVMLAVLTVLWACAPMPRQVTSEAGQAAAVSGALPPQEQRTAALQKAVVAACEWMPVASTIIALVPATALGSPAFDRVAQAICAKVQDAPSPSSVNAEMSVIVDGHVVRGKFVP
jgi:hypothetical protein